MSIPVSPSRSRAVQRVESEHVSSIRRVSGNDFDTGVGSESLARDPDNAMTQAKKRWLGRGLVRCLPTCDRAKDVVHRTSQETKSHH